MNSHSAKLLLKQDGDKIKNLRKQLEEAMVEIKRDVVLAYNNDVSITEISSLTGLTRQTIYTALDEADISTRGRI